MEKVNKPAKSYKRIPRYPLQRTAEIVSYHIVLVKPKTVNKNKAFLAPLRMKKFLLPFQNMVRADLFSGFLAVWNLRFGIFFARPPIPSPFDFAQDEDRIPFELFQEYTANWENANLKSAPRPAVGGTRLGFERVFLAKRKRIY